MRTTLRERAMCAVAGWQAACATECRATHLVYSYDVSDAWVTARPAAVRALAALGWE